MKLKYLLLMILCVLIDSSRSQDGQIEFQRFDGWYNNPHHPDHGAVKSPLVHQCGVGYADGVCEMGNDHRPMPGLVSDHILRGPDGQPTTTNLTALFALFGQFVASEMVSTVSSGEIACPAERSILTVGHFGGCSSPEDSETCHNSSTHDALFFRSDFDHGTGQFMNRPRQPVNFVTSWIDGSAIYGSSLLWANQIRAFHGGRLKSLPDEYFQRDTTEFEPDSPFSSVDTPKQAHFFGTGHTQSGRQPPLLAFSTLFHRYHNKQAEKLKKEHPDWSDEELFQTARRHVIGVLQNIVFYEYLPALLGFNMPVYAGYRPFTNPSISVEFQAAAFRVSHSFVPSGFFIRRRSGDCHSESFHAIPLCADTRYLGKSNFTMEDVIRGLASQRMERSDAFFSDVVQNHLVGGMNQPISQMDLAAMNVMRGRDVGLASYTTVRASLKMPRLSSFEDINRKLAQEDPGLFDRLKNLYRDRLDSLDLFVGGLLEINESESVVGQTFARIIADQFMRLREGDRFWFENEANEWYSEEEAKEIRRTTLYKVILETTDIGSQEIQQNVFYDTNAQCSQPYQLNATGMDVDAICGIRISHDYFAGNEAWFIMSMCILFAIPLACCFAAFILARYKTANVVSNRKVNGKKASMKRVTSTVVADAFVAEECTDFMVTRKIQMSLDFSMLHLRTYSREAKLLRVIDFNNMPIKIMVRLSCDVERNCALVVHIPKEYDLVLSFDTTGARTRFLESFRAFLETGGMKRQLVEVPVPFETVMDYATTMAQRRELLESFFHTAFDQVLHAKQVHRRPAGQNGHTPIRNTRAVPRSLLPHFHGSLRISTQSPSTKAKKRKTLLTTELNKLEFAEAFQIKPNSLFVNKMFTLADKDQNGYISYPEFIDILALLSEGSLESKMRMLFDMYDLDGSNGLDHSELKVMIRSLLEITGDRLDDERLDQLVGGMIAQCGFQTKELLSFDDFLVLIKRHQSQLADELSNLGFGFTRCEQDINTQQRKRNGDSPSPVLERHEDEMGMFQWWGQWQYYLENNWNKVFILITYLLLTVMLFFLKASDYYYQKEHIGARQVTGLGICISRGGATCISFSYALLILAVCRNLMTKLRNTWLARVIPFDDAITFHKYVAYTALFYSVIHVIGHGINFYEISTQPPIVVKCMFPSIYLAPDYLPSFAYWLYGTVAGMTGILLVVCLSIIYVFANGIARHHIYSAFYFTHRLFIPTYILTLMHGSTALLQEPSFYMFVIGPLSLYVIDWIISLQTQCVDARILKAEVLPSDVIHLRFKPRTNSCYTYHSGQYIRIACAEISEREFHPFTITTAPHEKYMSVHIRAVGPWTRRLLGIFKDLEPGPDPKYPKIYLDGPYGSSHQDWYKFEVVVLVGAGIGVTPHASVLKDLVHKVYHARSDITCRQVYFAWVARTHTQFEWFVDILREVEKQDENNLVRTDIFVTQLMKDFDLRTMMLYICEHQFQRISNTSLFTGLSAKTHFGRPNFNQYFFTIKRRHALASKIGVFTCGPKTIVRSVESACNQLNQLYSDGPRIVAHHEIF